MSAWQEKERYYIEFLNSYGAYECIEVTGKPTLDQDKGEDEVYGKYDEEVNDYTESREESVANYTERFP